MPDAAPDRTGADRARSGHLGADHTRADGPRPADAKSQTLRALVLGSSAALIALGLAWELWLAPTGSGSLALKVLPLLLALPGLRRHRLWNYRALSLLVWLYFSEGALRASTEAGVAQALAAVEIALALALFAGCAAYVRHRLQRGRQLHP